MTIPELAELLGISRRALYMRARRNAVPGIVHVPSGSGRRTRLRFSRKVITAWLEARDTDPYADELGITVELPLCETAEEAIRASRLYGGAVFPVDVNDEGSDS
jgi:predicted DNA-binding transcriptional regulator AlpA